MAEAAPAEVIHIAERDRNVRELQQFFLERAGYAVVFHDDGLSALEAARESAPALLVTEVLLPGLDGLTLCRQLRDDARTRHVPIIVFSILAAAARAADAGATAFVRKPLVESTFVAAIRAALADPSPRSVEHQWTSMS